MNSKTIIATAICGLSGLLNVGAIAADLAPDTKGKCYGVVGPHEGDCGGVGYDCAGNNPTADAGWKKMTKAECDKMQKHAQASKKYFEANAQQKK